MLAGGKRIRLKAVRNGQAWIVTEADLEAFRREVTAAAISDAA